MAISTTEQSTTADNEEFDLDVRLLEVADVAGLVNLTDDGCGSTCTACTTNVA
ncbi:FxLD family lanthipeptide [Micromonospora chaiyaphumensis]|uniref:FxLD family lantipeptide n=1 Tax=Micromonospora chaiyaphumensis TaxID=307119 RepID=A0A1C4ZMT2_9ACTN|nr:FxLD family lanthipeptide [Micromonospora chaiyaphumensis]SCF34094.1 FxLD family lantipeptide [Micromonospora chaiyaphumensis]